MKRKTSVLTGALLALAPFVVAQEPQNQASPHFPADVIPAQELIAWSWMQKPQPIPQPLPPPDKAVPQPGEPQPKPTDPSVAHQIPTQTFTGKIVKEGDHYLLKVSSSTSYQLDQEGTAKQFENKDVKVVGTLDSNSIIHVVKIELLS